MFERIRDRLSLCHGSMLSIEPHVFVHAAADAGFRRVSLRVRNPNAGAPGKLMGTTSLEGDTEVRALTLAALRERGVALMEAEASIIRPDTDLAELHPYMESAAVLGAVGVIPVMFGQTSEAQTIEQLGAFAAMAHGYGLKTMVEFIAISAIPSIGVAARVIRESGAENAGIIVDSLHLTRSGGSAADIRAVDPALIVSSQINDGLTDFPNEGDNWWREMALARSFLGEGDFKVREMIDALPPHVPIGVEVLSEAFQQRGLPPVEMARFLMENVRDYFASDVAATA